MGADFIEKAAPSFKRSWDRGRVRLGTAGLFTEQPRPPVRVIAGDVIGSLPMEVGDLLTIELNGSALVGRRGLDEVVIFSRPPGALVRAISSSCGIAKGIVEVVYERARVVEVAVC